MPTVPSSIALTTISGQVNSPPINNDYSAIQVAVNGLIAALGGGGTAFPRITWTALSGGPPASPSDGDIWIATAVDGNGTRWAFQYNAGSASSSKWEFIGGPETVAFVATEEATTSSTFVNFATRQSITLARAGDYLITTAADLESSVNNANCLVAPKIGAAATAAADGIELGQWAAGSLASGPRISLQKGPLLKTGIAASAVIELQIANSDNVSNVVAKNRLLAITPVRIA